MRRSATSRRTGTAEWNLGSADTYDAVVLVNVADRLWKAVVTADFEFFRAIAGPNDVADLYWLDGS